MHLEVLASFLLLVRWTTALELQTRATSTTSNACTKHPKVSSALAQCSTAAPFCASFLQRAPKTVIATATVTKTKAASTLDYPLGSTLTVSTTTTISVLTSTSTYLSCISPTATVQARIGVAQAGQSCGVGSYGKSAVSAACRCLIDSTVTSTVTATTSYGTTFYKHKTIYTYSSISTKYLSTSIITTTRISDRCHPPASAKCFHPEICGQYYYETQYLCGSNGENDCFCGYDSYNTPTCYFGALDCYSQPKCQINADCAAGTFCQLGGCCPEPRCMPYDTCTPDITLSSSVSPGSATATATVAAI